MLRWPPPLLNSSSASISLGSQPLSSLYSSLVSLGLLDSGPIHHSSTHHGPTDKEEAEGGGEELLSPVVVFAHGACATSPSEWMVRWKKTLGEALHAVEVITFDYPYISGGERKAPPKAEKLVKFHADIVRKAAEKYPGNPLILAGKSMGSRVSCVVASKDGINASAIVCLGYPLKGINGAIRDEVVLKLSVPVMFVQGTKDALCPLEKLEFVKR